MVKKKLKKIMVSLVLLTIAFIIIWLFLADFSQDQKMEYGVSFSDKYSQELELNPYQVLIALLDDLKVRKFRLMAYWDEIENNEKNYNYTKLDWQINEVGLRNGQVILAIGQRLPRWPECHMPKWAEKLDQPARQQKILDIITNVVNHYKNNKAIIAWQVENEPFLKYFGMCPPLDKEFYKKELALVRSLDSRPIMATESGELSTWLKGGKLVDYVGSSVYRITWNKHLGYFYYPLPAAHYYLKARIIKWLTPVKGIFVSEVQMEPWLGKPIIQTPLAEQYRLMNGKIFTSNLNYVNKTGLSPIYLWGAEWWYWLKQQGDSSIWNLAKKIWEKN